MKKLLILSLLMLGMVWTSAQSNEDIPAFYLEMKSDSPNVITVDSLYQIYIRNTPASFSPKELREIREMKRKSNNEKSNWLSHAKKSNASIQKEFRSSYEKAYLEWRKEIQPYIHADGSVQMPNEDEFIQDFDVNHPDNEREHLHNRRNLDRSGVYDDPVTPYHTTFAGWKYYGPVQLVNNVGVPNVTSQANVRAFAQSQTNPNVVVCSVESGTVYISHNKGIIWHLATKGYNIKNITALAISPTDEKVIYAASDNHQHFVSRDGGVTWKYFTSETNYHSLPIIGDSPGGASSKILITSTDDNPLHDLVLFSTAKGILKLNQTENQNGEITYSFAQKFAYPTTDIIKRTNRDEYFALGHDPQKKHVYFYSSTDQGESWQKQNAGWYEPNNAMLNSWGGRLAMSPNNEDIVYAHIIENRVSGDNGYLGVYRSDDGGQNWMLPNPEGPGMGANGYGSSNQNIVTFPWGNTQNSYHQGFYNCAIIVDPQNPMHIIVGGLNAYSSTDGATSFERFGGYWGPKQLHPDMQTFYQQKNANGSVDSWLTTDGGINYSTDFFENSNIVRTAGLGSDYWGFDLGEYHTTMGGGAYHNGNSYHVAAYQNGTFKCLGGGESSTGYIFPDYDERHMFFSDVGGIIAGESLSEDKVSAPNPSPTPNEPYAGRDTYYTQRDFRGNTYYYVQTEDDKQAGVINLFNFDNRNHETILVKKLQLEPGTPIQQYIVSFSHPLYQYIVAGHYIYASTDGGNNWQKMSRPFYNNTTVVVSDNNPKVIYALRRYKTGGNMLKRSVDGGNTFTEINNPDGSLNYRHIVQVRGTDIIFLFGNNRSKIFYLINGIWKPYYEDLPNNLNILEPKIQYRSGEFYMATSGAGIWTRELPSDVLDQMDIIKINISSPNKFSFIEDFPFQVINTSLYYGKNITNITWEFPGADQVLNANSDEPTVIYNKPGRFSVTLSLTDANGQIFTKTFENHLTVYPYCACEAPEVIRNNLGNIEVWFDASKANLDNNVILDKIKDARYSIKRKGEDTAIEEINGQPVISFKTTDEGYVDLNNDYEGKTFFLVSKLNPQTQTDFSFLFGSSSAADFHGGGRLGRIFSYQWIHERNRFTTSGAKTMINNVTSDYFNTNFVTDNLAVYTMRIGENQSPAKVKYISKDRDNQSNRHWNGEIAEVLIFNTRLSDDDISLINQYLLTKYQL